MSDEIKGPATIIEELQKQIDGLSKANEALRAMIVADKTGSTFVPSVLPGHEVDVSNGNMRVSGGAAGAPIPVAPDFAGIKPEASVTADTPTDALAVLALRVGDLETKLSNLESWVTRIATGIQGQAASPLNELIDNVDHLFSVLGFKKPEGNG